MRTLSASGEMYGGIVKTQKCLTPLFSLYSGRQRACIIECKSSGQGDFLKFCGRDSDCRQLQVVKVRFVFSCKQWKDHPGYGVHQGSVPSRERS